MLLVFLAGSMLQDVAHVGEIETFATVLYCGEVQAGEDVIWRLGNVIVNSSVGINVAAPPSQALGTRAIELATILWQRSFTFCTQNAQVKGLWLYLSETLPTDSGPVARGWIGRLTMGFRRFPRPRTPRSGCRT